MANPRIKRQARASRGSPEMKLNITSMMDMFTIILVFLIKNYSTEGAIFTPADNLTLPSSTVERVAREALSVKVSTNTIIVENRMIIGPDLFGIVADQEDFLIEPLHDVLAEYAQRARELTEATDQQFSGRITIQADALTPYSILTRIMYTCGQAGYPDMNLFVYRQE